MNKTLVLLYTTILTTTINIQASMYNLCAYPEKKVAREQRDTTQYDKAAEAKKIRKVQYRQWTMRQVQRQDQQAQQQALVNDNEELCSGSCGCLGRDKRRDCLASGFPLPLIGYMLKFFGL